MHKKNIIIIFAIFVFIINAFSGCMENTSDENNTETKGADTINTNDELDLENHNKDFFKYAISTGPKNSNISIVVASDFECPACRMIHEEFKKTVEKYYDRVQFGYISYPLSYHPNAMAGAKAVEAAQIQGKGWEMFEIFFENSEFDPEIINKTAEKLSLDIEKFEKDKNSKEIEDKINSGMKFLNQKGLSGTPTYYINGVEFDKNPTFANFSFIIEEKLK